MNQTEILAAFGLCVWCASEPVRVGSRIGVKCADTAAKAMAEITAKHAAVKAGAVKGTP